MDINSKYHSNDRIIITHTHTHTGKIHNNFSCARPALVTHYLRRSLSANKLYENFQCQFIIQKKTMETPGNCTFLLKWSPRIRLGRRRCRCVCYAQMRTDRDDRWQWQWIEMGVLRLTRSKKRKRIGPYSLWCQVKWSNIRVESEISVENGHNNNVTGIRKCYQMGSLMMKFAFQNCHGQIAAHKQQNYLYFLCNKAAIVVTLCTRFECAFFCQVHNHSHRHSISAQCIFFFIQTAPTQQSNIWDSRQRFISGP